MVIHLEGLVLRQLLEQIYSELNEGTYIFYEADDTPFVILCENVSIVYRKSE